MYIFGFYTNKQFEFKFDNDSSATCKNFVDYKKIPRNIKFGKFLRGGGATAPTLASLQATALTCMWNADSVII